MRTTVHLATNLQGHLLSTARASSTVPQAHTECHQLVSASTAQSSAHHVSIVLSAQVAKLTTSFMKADVSISVPMAPMKTLNHAYPVHKVVTHAGLPTVASVSQTTIK